MSRGRLLWGLAMLAATTPLHASSPPDGAPAAAIVRTAARAVIFGNGPVPSNLQPTTAFAPEFNARPPSRGIEGRLHLLPLRGSVRSRIYVDQFGIAKDGLSFEFLPPLDVQLVTEGMTLIPVERGPRSGTDANWEWIVGPGSLWTEPNDAGWMSAALPVSLRERNANCTHNGLAKFRVSFRGEISKVYYQFASETCAYFKLDLWGKLAARFEFGAVPNRDRIVARFRSEVASRLPTRPIEQLRSSFPSVDWAAFGAGAEVTPENMTLFGLIADDVHWVGGCQTRAGPHPYCEVVDLPSYSLAKSLVGGLGLMRLELLYPGSTDIPVSTAAAECSDWSGVRILDALDMATGRYRDPADQADEGSAEMTRFFIADTHSERSRLACKMFRRREAPGQRWVYHSSDSYLLGSAMQRAFRRKKGSSADFYRDLIVAPIWQKIGLSPVAASTLRSYDADAQPLTGWGLTLYRDDVARIANFLHKSAKIDGTSVVDPTLMAEAMQHDPAARGLQAGGFDLRYNHGFWAWNAGKSLGCSGDVWIPFMSGYGGIVVALFPNGMTYYYFSDGRQFSWAAAARAAHAMRPMCGEG